MTAVLAPALLALLLLTSALGGPWLLRGAAPALARTPRLAAGVLAGSIALWLLALLALGPLLAWTMSGPSLFSGPAAQVCQRCLDAANPFAGTAVDAVVPPALFLVAPGFGALVAAGSVLRHALRQRRATRATARSLAATATRARLAGHVVLRVPDPHPAAFALPRRQGGIVVTDGALSSLDNNELAAVLAHEHAHLRQHHHLVRTLVEGLARPLRAVPLVAAATAALPHYLEIAADDAARRHAGTPALAGALLKLGGPSDADRPAGVPLTGHLLHMAGPDRIRHLVAPAHSRAGAAPAVASVLHVTALGSVSAVVLLPYLTAAVAGCV